MSREICRDTEQLQPARARQHKHAGRKLTQSNYSTSRTDSDPPTPHILVEEDYYNPISSKASILDNWESKKSHRSQEFSQLNSNILYESASGWHSQERGRVARLSVVNPAHRAQSGSSGVSLGKEIKRPSEKVQVEKPKRRPPQSDRQKGMIGVKMFKLMSEHNAAHPPKPKKTAEVKIKKKAANPFDLLLIAANKKGQMYIKTLKKETWSREELMENLQLVSREYVRLCLKYPWESQKKKVDYKMWMVFHSSINMYLSKLKCKSQNSNVEAELRVKELCCYTMDVFKGFLAQLAEVSSKLRSTTISTDSENSSADNTQLKDQAIAKSKDSILKIAAFSYVVLGDVARYRVIAEQKVSSRKDEKVEGTREDPDWSKAVEYYFKALQVLPGYGKAYNQRAVISSYIGESFDQLYFYIRALSATDSPYPSRENLLQLVEKNRLELKNLQSSIRTLRKNVFERAKKKLIFPVKQQFMIRLTRVCAMVYTSIGMDEFDFLWNQMIFDFQYLLEDKYIDDLLLLKVVVMNIYSLTEAVRRETQRRKHQISIKNQSPLITESIAKSKPPTLKTKIRNEVFTITKLEDLGEVGLAALRLNFDLLGTSVSNVTAVESTLLQYLEPVTVLCVFLQNYPILASDKSESCLFFCASIYSLVQSWTSLMNGIRVCTRSKSYCGIFSMLNGFAPLEAIPDWINIQNKDLQWQFSVIKNTAKLLRKVNKMSWKDSHQYRKPPPNVTSNPSKKGNNKSNKLDCSSLPPAFFKSTSRRTSANVQKNPEFLQVNMSNIRFMMPILTRRNIVEEVDNRSDVSTENVNPYDNMIVVIDAPNVAMAAGGNSEHFRCDGIEKACNYYKDLGARVIAIIPEFYLSYSEKQKTEHLRRTNPSHPQARSMKIADNIRQLRRLKQEGVLFTTPKGDYDDSYCIEYARKHQGVIVSNDRYRDAIHKPWKCDKCETINRKGEGICKKVFCDVVCPIPSKATTRWRYQLSQWLRAHIIRFMFVNDDFIPNPDFVLP